MHENGYDHIHLGDEDDGPVYIGDRVELLSVGVDIGSSTSHLTFSRLQLERQGYRLSSRFEVTRREIVFRSPVIFTPYAGMRKIDATRLGAFIDIAYAESGISRDEVDTGAVITTGEAALRENARSILDLFSREGGRFVCATAGPNLESLLAAHGSGAVELSHGQGSILNIDIGGGTTKFAVCHNGRVEETAAIHVGARLLAWDERGRLMRVEEAGHELMVRAGLSAVPELGTRLSDEDLDRLTDFMADLILCPVTLQAALSDLPWITAPLKSRGPFRLVVFSGGVGEYVYGRENRDFGDLGPRLAFALRRKHTELGLILLEPKEAIRATCIGASQYTVQLSGDTIFLAQPEILPVRNIPTVTVRGINDPPTAASVARAIRQGMERLDLQDGVGPFALGIQWHRGADYASLRELCAGIASAALRNVCDGAPLVVILDADVAGIVGAMLQGEFGVTRPIVCIDQISLRDFDYVDVGRPISPQGVVPVVVKSLVFR